MNKQNLKQEENLAEFYTSKKLRTFTPGDATWYCSFQNESNWGRGVVIKKQDQSLILSIIAMVYSRNMLIYFVLLKLTMIDLKDHNLENIIDNETQNEHQISLTIHNNEKESELQN